MYWKNNPHTGGNKITSETKEKCCKTIERYMKKQEWYPDELLTMKFKDCFCYISKVEQENDERYPLCRLRYFRETKWSLAMFSHEKQRYEPSRLSNSMMTGSLKDVLKTCEELFDAGASST